MIELDFFEKEEIEKKLQVAYRQGFADGEVKGRTDERAKAIDEFAKRIKEIRYTKGNIASEFYKCFEISEKDIDEIAEELKELENE